MVYFIQKKENKKQTERIIKDTNQIRCKKFKIILKKKMLFIVVKNNN